MSVALISFEFAFQSCDFGRKGAGLFLLGQTSVLTEKIPRRPMRQRDAAETDSGISERY